MKRVSQRHEAILNLDNFRRAFSKATRGKRHQEDVIHFAADLDANLHALIERLRDGSYGFGTFTQFVIHDPKERIITAPCLRERILHHAIVNVCEPDFERFLIADTFACRKGKGRLTALARAQHFAGRRQLPPLAARGWLPGAGPGPHSDVLNEDRVDPAQPQASTSKADLPGAGLVGLRVSFSAWRTWAWTS
jgi:hypothetical protein